MKETKRSYTKEIRKYFNGIYPQFEKIFKECLTFEYDQDVEQVDIIIHHGAFSTPVSIAVMRIYNNGLEGDALDEDFDSIRPFLDWELDFYDIDFEYRGHVFMNEVFRVFARAWESITKCNNIRQIPFYVLEDNGNIRFSLNNNKILKNPI